MITVLPTQSLFMHEAVQKDFIHNSTRHGTVFDSEFCEFFVCTVSYMYSLYLVRIVYKI